MQCSRFKLWHNITKRQQAELDTVGFILSHLVNHAHVSQLVYKGQTQVFCLHACAQYKEVIVKTQLQFKNLNLSTGDFIMQYEGLTVILHPYEPVHPN